MLGAALVYDWTVNDLSATAKANGGADVTDKIYMGWATANAPSVAGGITSAILANQALTKVGGQVGGALGANAGTPAVQPMNASGIPDVLRKFSTPYSDRGTTASVQNEADLIALYGRLTTGGSAPVQNSYGSTVKLSDGTAVTLRNKSSSGGATIDINYKESLGNNEPFKIHINQ